MLREQPLGEKSGEQLEIPGIRLGELIRALDLVEGQKKEANESWNIQIKSYKKEIVKLAYSMNPRGQ